MEQRELIYFIWTTNVSDPKRVYMSQNHTYNENTFDDTLRHANIHGCVYA